MPDTSIVKIPKIKSIYDHSICNDCGGDCCKKASCMAHPSDFGKTRSQLAKNLKVAFESGMWIVDWWEGDCPGLPKSAKAYFIRPRMYDETFPPAEDPGEGSPFYYSYILGQSHIRKYLAVKHGAWGGQCVFQLDDGCAMPDDVRPLQARAVIPKSDRSCSSTIPELNIDFENDKIYFAKAWYQYEQLIDQVLDELRS